MKTFKNLVLALLAFWMLQSCMVSEKPNMAFFNDSGYDFKEAKFVSINVPMFLAKPYIRKALKEDADDEELWKMVKKISKIRVMTVENGDRKMLKDFAGYLNNNHYEDWATIKHDGDNVNIRVKQKGNAIKNMLITINSDKDLVFVDVRGSFTANDISKMINSVSDK
ncbi:MULTISPECIES: DUF4252 domain-containing protein [Chryseobacterium]|uniref:DUF4252 domain-containing protein n=1 Tax=Chryseobacterium camelliae TaxID=1265445 RepID=A0ABU0TM40_9FLAO|nr:MULTISPECIES: DUF4252 domain-containing protein [Chryseobacterium]MDT3408283.1 hypothetical protein [Pseudacidovorax intermedius]MDQ1097861.1 hypothetical protein [Chryseobacterium camelliae]MDQ1101796.1 hypothetical protein [Chryseobacterium sp. SORGH_AS_1048]MDR6085234.1 hypothetical protein [Chryseobacterium sp. SORGH_AS_0909]MDR6129592.1 hypothetical protein [Chryseobacterium sp. SORGH_AS_1175]